MLTKKIVLGTVQFGLKYGITNQKGKLSRRKVSMILHYAHEKGINTLDTASSYGVSEEVIGAFISSSGKKFNIISKMPDLDTNNFSCLNKYFSETLYRLKQKKIYGYLIHNFDGFLKNSRLWDFLKQLKEQKIVRKIGFSIYKPEELDFILNKKLDFDVIQVPYSVFDRRFENYFETLRKKKIKIYVRSVFLQGLAFMQPFALPENLKEANNYLKILRSLAVENNISVNALCLNFVLLNSYVDKVIIGVDSLKQLERNLDSIALIKKVKNIYKNLNILSIKDENILLPYRWGVQ